MSVVASEYEETGPGSMFVIVVNPDCGICAFLHMSL
jgi:hypothetical protein